MAEKNFFDLLKEKIAALRPSDKHRDDDWAILSDRLNAALPLKPRRQKRGLVVPLLLLAALLSSNAAWWHAQRSDRLVLSRLETQISGLQSAIASRETVPATVRTDTLWRTVYVQRLINPEPAANAGSTLPKRAGDPKEVVETEKPARQPAVAPASVDLILQPAPAPFLETPGLVSLKVPNVNFPSVKHLDVSILKDKELTKPIGKKLLDALRPKYFSVGANFGWYYAKSSGLMHEGGFSYGAEAVIGFSRRWSLTADYREAQLHYKAHDPAAVLGAPSLPAPGYGHHLTEMDITGQKVRQFNVGLRYTFARPDKPQPFLGLGWGGLTVLPYTVEYEMQHEPSGAIHKGSFSISERTRLRNILRFGAGLEIPLSRRFDLMLEGVYMRQWKKQSGAEPDLVSIGGGVNWSF